MSSELVVRAIPIVQSPTQDAVSKRSHVESNVSKISPLSAKASVESGTGNSLPNSGSDVPVAITGQQSTKASNPLSSEEVLEAVQNLNDFVQKTRRELNFSVDEQTGRTVVKVIDHETKDVIRQIPAEEILDVARRVVEQNDEKGNLLRIEV
jgi:flagellar protein FlaG